MSDPKSRERPGLAKVRKVPLLRRRNAVLVATIEGRWREMLDAADVVSEGRARDEDGTLVYYGTTSLLFRCGDGFAESDLHQLAAVLRHDPHTRLRAIRVARREAAVRAAAPIGSVRAELSIRATSEGLAITVDVVARVRRDEGRRRSARNVKR